MQLSRVSEKNEKRVLFFIFLVTVIFRTIFVYVTYTKTESASWVDDLYYIDASEHIADGSWDFNHGESDNLIVGPLLPILGALFIRLFGDIIIPFFVYNIIVTSLMVPVFYYLGKEIFNKKLGWFLAIWGVFFIEAYKYSPHILKEPTLFLFVPLTLFFIISSIKREAQRIKYLLFASLSFAFLIHTDERFFVYFPVFILFFLFIKPLTLFSFTKFASLWIVFVFLLMLPWGIRNFMVFDQVVILSPRTTAITSKLWGDNLAAVASHFSDKEAQQKLIDLRHNRAIQFGAHYSLYPREYGKLEAQSRAFINFWQPTYFRPTFIQYGYRPMKWSLRHNVASILFYGIFLPFYIIGFFVLINLKKYLALAVAIIPIIHSFLHAYMVWPLERYRSPVTFIVVMIGIWLLNTSYEHIKSKRSMFNMLISI